MTIFNTKYEAYNSSWWKFLGLSCLPLVVGINLMRSKASSEDQHNVPPSFTAKLPCLICYGISNNYFIHNLYAQYQHNKSLEAQLKVEIDGEVKTINASPNYFDAYTTYNILCTVVVLCDIIDVGISSQQLRGISSILSLAGLVSKLVSLGDDYQEYNFTDENGNSISPEIVAWSNVSDVEYLKDIKNIPSAINDQENIDQDTEVETLTIAETCDNLQLTVE